LVAAARDALGFTRGLRMWVGQRLVVAEPQLLRQFWIEPSDRRPNVVALRRFGEAFGFRRRFARLVGGGEIGAAVERIIWRRL
jgi:hypothetical protein